MEAFKQRLVVELTDLEAKQKGLKGFLRTEAFNKLGSEDRILLELQHDTMCTYIKILKKRMTLLGIDYS